MQHALTNFRAKKNLSKAEIARRARTTRQTVHRVEKGEQTPSMDLVRRLIDACDGRLRADDFMPRNGAA